MPHAHHRLLLRLLLVSIALAGAAGSARAASLFDPAFRFRVLTTEHFVIYFHQGAQPIAMRLAPIAEETWRALEKPLGVTPPPRTHVVLADQTELANGYATPLPRDTIVIYTTWPGGVETIGDADDWLRLAFTHEFTHIVHLDRSESWARVVRNIFGRTLLAFPNETLPIWQIEGLAVYAESVATGAGRLHAGDFRAIVDESARRRTLEPIDRVNGGLTDWPGGGAAYAYGLGFHEYLANRFGAESLSTLAQATARQLPYTGSRAFKQVYGEPLGDLWREYEASAVSKATPPSGDDHATRVTHEGFDISAPRFDRYACGGCAEIVYVASSPHAFPAMKRVALGGPEPTTLARRYLGSTTAIGRKTLYFDQLEARRNVGLYGDLYAMDRADGSVRQLTTEARLTEPDLSPDEQSIVAVQDRVGSRALVLVRLGSAATIEALIVEPETQFDAPRWSPDGRTIAAERHRLGTRSELVVVDVETRNVRVVASMPEARIVTPAWTPDGRSIVAAVAPDDHPFNLFEFDAVSSAARQLTHTTGGATWPDVSADGKTMAFVGYTVEGFDVFTMPYPTGPSPSDAPASVAPFRPDAPRAIEPQERPTSGYSPLPTLGPTSWWPIFESDRNQLRFGAATSGGDILGYHLWSVSGTWLATGPDGAPVPDRGVPDWTVTYAYDRWRPTLFASASSATTFFDFLASAAGTPEPSTRRERQFEGGVLLPMVHTRVRHAAFASVVRASDEFTLPDQVVTRDHTDLRFAWTTITSHSYGYSISPEDGVAIGATADLVRAALGSPADAAVTTVDVRSYLPGFAPHHVIALRAGAGASTGDAASGRTFLLGGGGPDSALAGFNSDALSLLRGFPSGSFAGSHVYLLNADYRAPIARPQRGIGTWPLLVHTIHGAVFADAGDVWTTAFTASAVKTSVGAELSTDLVAGYYFPFTVTAGAAWGHDGSGNGATFYARIGRAF